MKGLAGLDDDHRTILAVTISFVDFFTRAGQVRSYIKTFHSESSSSSSSSSSSLIDQVHHRKAANVDAC
jgi:hypothetical protein